MSIFRIFRTFRAAPRTSYHEPVSDGVRRRRAEAQYSPADRRDMHVIARSMGGW